MIEVAQARIERGELTERLRRGLDQGSVVLCADAGFGKTTALEQALAGRDGPVVWLRATRGDRDPGRLVARLVDRLREQLPGVAEDPAERLGGALEPLDVQALAEDLVADLGRLLVEPLVVVIDDAEELDGAAALAVIDTLLAAEGGLLRVAICSRRPPGLRLAKLRATGSLLELGPADLAFSPSECAACLRVAHGRDPSGADAERLFELTEGWPLGVALAVAAKVPPGELAASSRDAIFAYLAEEVLDELEPELRDRLCDASIVDELDPALERALGLPPSFRDDLVRHGFFVRAHGAGAYSIHPLMRELLRDRLNGSREADHVAGLDARAAAAFAAAGRVPDAIEHWFAAGAFEEAAGAIEAQGIQLIGAAPETVAGWLERLPEELCQRPLLRLLAGRVEMGEGRFDAAVEHCRAGVAGLESQGAPEALLWSARLALTDAQIAALDLDAAAETSAGADAAGPEAGPAAVFCELLHAALLARLGVEGSDRVLDAALARPRARELLGRGLAAFRAQYRELPAGRLDDALEQIDEGIDALEAQDPYGRLPYVFAFKMAIHEARGELEEALQSFDDLQAAAHRTGLAGFIGAGARLSAATMLLLLGRDEEARVQLERVDRGWSSWVGCDRHVARALLAARADDMVAAFAESRRALEDALRMPAFDRVRPLALLAPVVCEAGRPATAREALAGLLEALGPGDSKARTRAALACVLHRSGDEAAAHAALRAAFQEAGDGARFFLRTEWPHVEEVLWGALEAGALEPVSAVEALEAAFPGGAPVVRLLDHPDVAVRAAALGAAAAAGRPEAIARLSEGDADEGPSGGLPIEALRDRVRRQPPPLAFRTLGRFVISRGAYAIDGGAWERKVAERVVRLLLVREGEFVPEDELLEALWPGKPMGSSRRGLQTAISSARAVLDLPWEESRLHVRDRSYALVQRDEDRLDAAAFEAAARRALGTGASERIPAMEAATRLWAGEPLVEERYSDWAAAWRERLTSLHADVLGALAEAHGEAGDRAAAARAARALVDLDPLDEHAQRLLMRAYAAAGRRGDALRQFLECRRALVEQLGIEPGAETVALQRRILAGDNMPA